MSADEIVKESQNKFHDLVHTVVKEVKEDVAPEVIEKAKEFINDALDKLKEYLASDEVNTGRVVNPEPTVPACPE